MSCQEFRRARSIFERALHVEYQNVSLWLKYLEMEMKNKFVNHARNLFDRVPPARLDRSRTCRKWVGACVPGGSASPQAAHKRQIDRCAQGGPVLVQVCLHGGVARELRGALPTRLAKHVRRWPAHLKAKPLGYALWQGAHHLRALDGMGVRGPREENSPMVHKA